MIFYYVTIGLCIVTYRTVNVTYMRITKYYICLVWIFTQYNFAVFWYYIILSIHIHFPFFLLPAVVPVSDFFAVSIRVQMPAVVLAPPVVPVSVPAVAQVTAVAVSVLEMAVVPVLVPAMA